MNRDPDKFNQPRVFPEEALRKSETDLHLDDQEEKKNLAKFVLLVDLRGIASSWYQMS